MTIELKAAPITASAFGYFKHWSGVFIDNFSLFNTKLQDIYKNTPELGLAKKSHNSVAVDVGWIRLDMVRLEISSQEILCEHI